MIKRLSPQMRLSLKEKFTRIDRVAADLNVLLAVVAIGLALLDMTFFLTEAVVENLPPVTHITYDQAPPAAK